MMYLVFRVNRTVAFLSNLTAGWIVVCSDGTILQVCIEYFSPEVPIFLIIMAKDNLKQLYH